MRLDRREFLSSAACGALLTSGSALAQMTVAGGDHAVRVRHRYVRVNGRDIYYLSVGKGPPLVLLHGSPGDSSFFLRELPELGSKYAVYAFDTPGFGRSEPMPEAQRDVAFLADAVADAMRALKLPAAVVYGSHTGAVVATELAVRHPSLVRAVMLDGLPIFNEQELRDWFPDFLPPLVPDPQGGHFAAVWTRCRDQGLWFPWSYKQPDHLLNRGLSTPMQIHGTVMSIMRCGRLYERPFRSALSYGRRVPAALDQIEQPTMILCAAGDPLGPHIDRLPALRSNQEARKLPTGKEVRALRDQWLPRHIGEASAPPIPNGAPTGTGICAHVVELEDGREVFMRVAGTPNRPAIVLIHDAPGSSRMHEPLIAALSAHARVYALDLPGCGESDPLAMSTPTTSDYAELLGQVVKALGIPRAVVYGIGFGSIVALEFSILAGQFVDRLVLQSVPLPTAEERLDLAKNYAPAISVRPDGSHWYATWLMLRDAQTFWPWYASTSAEGLRRVAPANAFDANHLHDWTVEVMKQYGTYQHVIQAALTCDAAARLSQAKVKLILCSDPSHPFAVYQRRLRDARLPGPTLQVTGDPMADARQLAALIGL